MGVLSKITKGAKKLAGDPGSWAKSILKQPGGAVLNPVIPMASWGKDAVKATKSFLHPELPEMPGQSPGDTMEMQALAEEAAKRRRGTAGRSLLRTSALKGASSGGTMLGRSGA